jgi:hypothetical protein
MRKPRWVEILVPFCVAVGLSTASVAGPSPVLRLRPPVSGCPVCELWLEYEDVILRAKQEVGPLEDGVLYFYHSADPSVIEPMIRFAHERSNLAETIRSDPAVRESLGGACGHGPGASTDIDLEISTSARGIFALIRSSDRATYTRLRFQAGRAVRSQIPVWF